MYTRRLKQYVTTRRGLPSNEMPSAEGSSVYIVEWMQWNWQHLLTYLLTYWCNFSCVLFDRTFGDASTPDLTGWWRHRTFWWRHMHRSTAVGGIADVRDQWETGRRSEHKSSIRRGIQ